MVQKEHKKWIALCFFGGFLMFLGSIIGSASFFALVFDYSKEQLNLGSEAATALSITLIILVYIAMGGGISVMVGSILVAMDKYGPGKFIIGVGAGMGLIGLIIFLITSILAGSVLGDFTGIINGIINGSYGFLGVLLTIWARKNLKKD